MRLLLDTCTFLWLIWDERPLHAAARQLFTDPDNTVYLSAVSIWEASSKHALGKLQVQASEPAWQHFTQQRERHEIEPLPLNEAGVRHVSTLPLIHRDPFDRLLICQAIEHGLTIITPDSEIRRYPIKTFW